MNQNKKMTIPDEKLNDNYRDLAFAIVCQAINEYVNKMVRKKRKPLSYVDEKELESTKKFLLSSWCYELLNSQDNQMPEITGEKLLECLDKQIEIKVRNKDLKINKSITMTDLTERMLEDEERENC